MCDCACRCVLVVVNSLAGLVAAAFLIFGALMLWSPSTLGTIINNALVPLASKITIQGQPEKVQQMANYGIQLLRPVALAIFIMACIILVICIIGCIGGACDVKILLQIYIALLSIILLAHIILLIVYAVKKDSLANTIVEKFKTMLLQYVSLSNGDSDSIFGGLIMGSLHCCGYTGGSDYNSSTYFVKTDSFSGQTYTNLKYPITCCKMDDFKISVSSCPATFNDQTSNINTGCAGELTNKTKYYLNIAAYVTLIMMAVEVGLIIMAAIAICC